MVPNDKYFKKNFISIVNVLKKNSTKLKISGIAIAGSRARQQQNYYSDEDIIVSAAGDPRKDEFYPKLMDVLEDNFQHWEVYPGENYNVVHMDDPKTGGEFELVLRTEEEFDKQHGTDVKFRRMNL